MEKGHDHSHKRGPGKPLAHPWLVTGFSLSAAVFAFAAGFMLLKWGKYIHIDHWTLGHVYALVAVFALASLLAALIVSILPHSVSAKRAVVYGVLAWWLPVIIVCLFVFRLPIIPSVEYTTHRVEDPGPGVTEVVRLEFQWVGADGDWLLGWERRYTLAKVHPEGTFCFLDPAQCHLEECLTRKAFWFAGVQFSRRWYIGSDSAAAAKDLVNVQCHAVDPSNVAPDDYDQYSHRYESSSG